MPYRGRMETKWLQTSSGDLVEVYSGATIEVLDGADGSSRVTLRSGGQERELYRGHEFREYVTGMARVLGATTPDWLVGNGKLGKRA